MRNNSKGANRITKLPQFAIKFSNGVFLLAVFFSILIAIFIFYKAFKTYYVYNYDIFILFSVIFAILFGIGLRLSNDLKVNFSLLLCSVVITIYTFEIYLEFVTSKTQSEEKIVKQLGVPFDSRTIMEVIKNLNETGVSAYSSFIPKTIKRLNGLSSINGRIYPLGGIPNVITVNCNELGYWSIYESDKYGFNNPKGLYKKNKVDIMLVGDSMTEGSCVNSDASMSAVLRELGFNAISIGKNGNGPLIELASIKEYAEPLEPKIVLWLYYVNDITDLIGEMGSPLLRKYLEEDNYTQNLISREGEIEEALKNYDWEQLKIENPTVMTRVQKIGNRLIRIFKLVNLRSNLNFFPKHNPAIFKKILKKSRKMVSGWGGELYFVYLPSYSRYYTGNEHINRESVLRTATELDIPIIDIHREGFAHHTDPLSLFPFKHYKQSHYNVYGYRLVAELIGKRLEKDGINPINSNN